MATPPASKSTQGRKKIEMKLIKKKTARMVTFSKRRASLFRKASELATLCNAHLAIMMFSPGGKIYSFGHPNVGAVLERYESSYTTRINNDHDLCSRSTHDQFMRMGGVKGEKTLRLKMELQRTLDDIQAKRETMKMLDMVWEKEHATRYWWNAPVEEMDMDSCKALEEKLLKLRMEVEAKLMKNNVVVPNHSSSHDVLPPANNLVAGWINSANNVASNMTNFFGNKFCNFDGNRSGKYSAATSSTSGATIMGRHVLGPKLSYGVESTSNNNFNNFPF